MKCGGMEKLLVILALHLTGIAVVPSSAAKPDIDNGRKVFAACAACHASDQATPTGPELSGVFGRKPGSLPGFRYSRALKNAKFVWDETALDAFLAEPQAAVPGNTMPFPGLPDAEQRRDLVAYLKTLK